MKIRKKIHVAAHFFLKKSPWKTKILVREYGFARPVWTLVRNSVCGLLAKFRTIWGRYTASDDFVEKTIRGWLKTREYFDVYSQILGLFKTRVYTADFAVPQGRIWQDNLSKSAYTFLSLDISHVVTVTPKGAYSNCISPRNHEKIIKRYAGRKIYLPFIYLIYHLRGFHFRWDFPSSMHRSRVPAPVHELQSRSFSNRFRQVHWFEKYFAAFPKSFDWIHMYAKLFGKTAKYFSKHFSKIIVFQIRRIALLIFPSGFSAFLAQIMF